MQKLGFALSILVLPFFYHSVQAQAAETKAETSTVSGRVTLKGEPARGVMVVLQAQSQMGQGASTSPRARVDESGRFHFTGVPAGMYMVSAIAPGFVSPDDASIGILRGKTLNVAEGEKVENLELEIRRGGVIAGRVTDSQGRPVIEETINLGKLDRNNRAQSFFLYSPNYEMQRTDDHGVFRIYGLPEGRYLVSVGYAQTPGSASIASSREFYPRVFYPSATMESEAKVIEISEGSEATDIDITVPDPKQTHDVYGRVLDAGTGQPVTGVDVVIGGLTPDGKYSGVYAGAGARSEKNGEFRIFGALPGRYAILVRPGDLNGPAGYISDPVIFDISEGDATGVEVRVGQGASISGVAVIEGTNDPKVLAKLSQISLNAFIRPTRPGEQVPPSRGFNRVNADGSFRISGLRPGKVRITLIQLQNARDLSIARIERNGATVGDGIDIEAGDQVTGVRLVLVHGSLTLRGELKIVGGALPAGYMFYATVRRNGDQSTLSTRGVEIDARGQFLFENMPPGEYEIGVQPTAYQDGQPLSPEIRRLISSVREKVIVSSGNQQPVTLVIDLGR